MWRCVKEIGLCYIAVHLTHLGKTHWIVCSAGKTTKKLSQLAGKIMIIMVLCNFLWQWRNKIQLVHTLQVFLHTLFVQVFVQMVAHISRLLRGWRKESLVWGEKYCLWDFFCWVVGIWRGVILTIQIFVKAKNNFSKYWTS